MGKSTPRKRWQSRNLEHFTAFKTSGSLEDLRTEGLSILKRTKLFTAEEWSQPENRQARFSDSFQKWLQKCHDTAARFGLNTWTVEIACLLEGYTPETDPFVMEPNWPKIRVITDSNEPLFLRWLRYEAYILGVYVIQRSDLAEITMIDSHSPKPRKRLSPLSRPPQHSAFYIRVETPAEFPPEAGAELYKQALNLARELLRRLGYPAPQRLRPSTRIDKADKLKVNKSRLSESETAQIIDELYPDTDNFPDDLKLHKRIKLQKYKLRRRLIKPYEQKE